MSRMKRFEMRPRPLKEEDGMVAVVVTTVLMIIITLVVSSFAVIVRREQRQSLDRELSTQAFYAAETGVSNAVLWLKAGLATNPGMNVEINDCNSFDYASFAGGIIRDSVQYSCVLIDGDPEEIEYGNVDAGSAILVPINTENVPDGGIQVSWENTNDSVAPGFVSSLGHNLPQTTGLPTAVVEATLIEGFANGPKNRAQLVNAAQTAFLYPSAGATGALGSIAFTPGANQSRQNQGEFVDGACNIANRSSSAHACRVRFTGLTQTSYYLRLKPLYQDTKFRISGIRGGAPQELKDAQALIDVTGKANDVLRRIQVRVPINGDSDIPTFPELTPLAAIESVGDVCKRLLVIITTITDQCTP